MEVNLDLVAILQERIPPFSKLLGIHFLSVTPERLVAEMLVREERHEGVWDNTYRWEENNKPTRYPACLEGKVIEIGLSQPGASDDGQPYPSSDP